ncbi:2-amino-4-hydroxy-6-hydroxymethyldihydropteridine diphosphokinase [Pollutibacter soli]|uniref:2-amino-4-hydroxy-6- hydroxymethyldihydropteridine diphosphokinase n=1 Tax=Pollutibacter soli TaxID=3034157 RepID=UPI003013CE87
MKQVYLLIGGNLGNRTENLAQARKLIGARCGKILNSSSLYETAAWGDIPQPDFLNQVLEIDTPLASQELLPVILAIENDLGRFRNERYGPRTIDIDILFYNDIIVDEKHLQIPHPRIAERRFVLTPMNEIAPDFIHPVAGKTISWLLANCKDELAVYKYFPIVNNKD